VELNLKKIIKKVIVYSLLVDVGQFGLSASIIEALPRSDWQQQQNDRHWQENNRHKHEMQRRHNENARDWNDCQWQKNQTHDQMVRQIEADIIVMALNN